MTKYILLGAVLIAFLVMPSFAFAVCRTVMVCDSQARCQVITICD